MKSTISVPKTTASRMALNMMKSSPIVARFKFGEALTA